MGSSYGPLSIGQVFPQPVMQQEELSVKRRFPATFYNPLSLIGIVIAVFNVGLILFFTVVETLTKHPKPYADVIIFIILPVFVLCGLALFVIGVIRERRRMKAGRPAERLPVIDFNDPSQRITMALLGTGFVLLSLLYAFISFNAYEYVESDTFCGMLCHRVMGPESTAHGFSPHAEINCVVCHVGSGAKHFFLSKLNGTRQLYALVFDKYKRPIPVPVKDLRPAEDTCKTCHGLQYALSEKLDTRRHFLSDARNTEWTIYLLLKMGTGRIETEKPPRVHWHATVAKEIRYFAADRKRLVIPWIQATGYDGKERVYRSTDSKATDEELSRAEKRVMDCIDCHNRTGHFFRPPDQVLNAYLQERLIDPSLPEIKSIAMKALEKSYDSGQAGRNGIREIIMGFYEKTYPELSSSKKAEIEKAVKEVQTIYGRNYDPAMKVSWRSFPDNAGHMYSPGCFRCHDGRHVSSDGKVLSRDCSLCHLLITRAGDRSKGQVLLTTAAYPHPVDVGDSYKEMNCSDCHGTNN